MDKRLLKDKIKKLRIKQIKKYYWNGKKKENSIFFVKFLTVIAK